MFHRQQGFFDSRTGIGNLAGSHHRARFERIAITDLPGADANHVCQQVQVHLTGKRRLRHAKTAECTGRRIVCVYCHAVDFDVGNLIWTGNMGTGPLYHRTAERCVCPGIGDDARPHADQPAVSVTAGGQFDFHRVSFRMHPHAFLAGQRQFHRLTGLVSQQRRMMLHRQIFLAAERSADQLADHPHLFAR